MANSADDDDYLTTNEVFKNLHQRAKSGFKHATFQQAFWVGLVLAGGIGVWLEAYKLIWHPQDSSLAALRSAISTFFPAVIGATSLQMAFEDSLKANRGIAFCSAFLLLIVFLFMADSQFPNILAFPLGLSASLVSLWIWCAANGNSMAFRELPTNASLGDLPLDAQLQGEADLKGLKH